MAQQTADSKVGECGANNESSVPNSDKRPPDPVVAKSMTLPDSQCKNLALQSVVCATSQKENDSAGEVSKICGSKRTAPDCPSSSPQTHCPTSNSGNGHLVYVRRKPDAELSKSTTSEDQLDVSGRLQQKRFNKQDENVQRESHMKKSDSCLPEAAEVHMKKSDSCLPEAAEVPKASLVCLPTKPSPVSSVHTTSVNHLLDTPKRAKLKQWEERYRQLQNLLNSLDQSKQEDYIQMLRSLSSVELSKHAVELEKRSIQLSLEEAKEMRWVKFLDVLGKDWNPRAC